MSRREPTTWMQKTSKHGGGEAIGRVGDDVEGSSREPQVGGVCAHDGRPAGEAGLELLGAAWMKLDGDDLAARIDQGSGDGAESGADVEDQRPFGKTGLTDELLRDLRCELVPSPALRWLGHGGAPS